MGGIMQSEIFFFTTTIAVVLLTIVGIITLVYLIRILRTIDSISGTVKKETEFIAQDYEEARKKFKEGARLAALVSIFTGLYRRAKGRKKENKNT